MFVSVVMSVWNAEEFVAEAISSILDQTHTDFELIIVNDASTDRSLEIIKSFHDQRIILIDQCPNQGLSISLNKGIAISRGEFIARMDADDVAKPERLAKQVQYLKFHKDCILLGTQADLIDNTGCYLYTSRNPESHNEIIDKMPDSSFFHSSVMFSKTAFQQCLGYEESIVHHFEDKLLWNKMAQIGCVNNLNEALILYRLLPFSISNNDPGTNGQLKNIADSFIKKGTISNDDLSQLRKLTVIKKKKRLAHYHHMLGSIHLTENFNRNRALKNLILSVTYDPFHLIVYRNIFLSLLPKSLVFWIKKHISATMRTRRNS